MVHVLYCMFYTVQDRESQTSASAFPVCPHSEDMITESTDEELSMDEDDLCMLARLSTV